MAILAISALLVTGFTACGKESEVSTSSVPSSETSAVSVSSGEPLTASVEEKKPAYDHIPVLRDSMEREIGAFAGCAVTGSEIDDEKVWDIITTHFSAVTLGNELKPDALFNYSNGTCPGKETVTFNGEELVVPVLDYSRAEKILNKIYDWNEEHPDRFIKVRGHVLVWHSQTPEWFFHEDYDKKNPYVSPEEMNKRLEWYICTVLTHFTGEDSKYKDMFYGWDVVNEAISDATGDIRTNKESFSELPTQDTHGSNSSWYAVYGSNEFIINAFKYANKYAPAELELYYNDYNECTFDKQRGIIKLLEAIKAEEGEPGVGTRISAMGMQGHYSMDTPEATVIGTSIAAYCRVVGKVQLTEIDVSASDEYDGSEESVIEENEKLRKRYNMILYGIKTALVKPDVTVEGLTFWGTVDHYSWLQTRSDIGGGNKSGLPQMPLLFDQNYEPKPCFFVFAKDAK